MLSQICFKDGNIQYFKQTWYFFILGCFFMLLCMSWFVMFAFWSHPQKLCDDSILRVNYEFVLLAIQNNHADRIDKIKEDIINKIKKHHDTKKLHYMTIYITKLIISLIPIALFFYLLLNFNSLYLQRIYPLCLYFLFCMIFTYQDMKIFRVYLNSQNIIKVFGADEKHTLMEGFLNEIFYKKFIIFICFIIFAIITIIYYSWEIFSSEEYDIVLVYGESVIDLYELWINPKLFNKSDSTIYGNYSVEIPREIGLIMFNHPRIKGDNHVKFYVKKSDKKTLICVFGDETIMYSKIDLY